MQSTIKYLNLLFATICFGIIIICPILGEDIISKILEIDIISIHFIRGDAVYEFSLVDKFPIIIASLSIIGASCLYCFFKNSETYLFFRNSISFFKNYGITTFHEIKGSSVKYLLLILTMTLSWIMI